MIDGENLLAESRRGGLGAGLTTLILGAVILWVGKTTFEHAGQLAGVEHQLNSLNGKNDTLHNRYEKMVNTMAERTRSRFTREDADKLVWRVQDLKIAQDTLQSKVHDRLSALRLKLSTVHSNSNHSSVPTISSVARTTTVDVADQNTFHVLNRLQDQVNALQAEVNQLHRMVEFSRSTPFSVLRPNKPEMAARIHHNAPPPVRH